MWKNVMTRLLTKINYYFKYRLSKNYHKKILVKTYTSYSLDQKLACGTEDEQLHVLPHPTTCTEQTMTAKGEKAQI